MTYEPPIVPYKLPVVRIKNRLYTVDDRTCQIRPNDEPWNPIKFDIIPDMLNYLVHRGAVLVETPQRLVDESKLPPNFDDDRFSWLRDALDSQY